MIELGILIRLIRLMSFATHAVRAARAVPGGALALVVLLSGQGHGRRPAGRS